MVNLGLASLGYRFVLIDDQWQSKDRDPETGKLVANPSKFPHGIKPLADYVHSKGLLFGLYSNAAEVTCSGSLPGHLGNEALDAETFVEWGVDYLKSDNCYPQGVDNTNVDKYTIAWAKSLWDGGVVQSPSERERYLPMVAAIEAVRPRRNITLELCLYGWDHVEKWASTTGDHLWRATQDIADNWPSVTYNLDCLDTDRFYDTSGPSKGWAYGDALQVGHSLSTSEQRSHFALWAATKSPLFLGFDLRGRAKNDSSVVTVSNRDLIAVNQDLNGKPARCVMGCTSKTTKVLCAEWWGGGGQRRELSAREPSLWPPRGSTKVEVWTAALSGGAHVVIVVNRADGDEVVKFDWSTDAMIPAGCFALYDMWAHAVVGNVTSPLDEYAPSAKLASHAHLAFRLDPVGLYPR